MNPFQLALCALLSITVPTDALQHGRDETAVQWNPFATSAEGANAKEASSDKKAPKHVKHVKKITNAKKVTEKSTSVQEESVDADEVVDADENVDADVIAQTVNVSHHTDKNDTKKPKGPYGGAFDWQTRISRPRMLISAGCDGSRAIIRHAHFIMKLHNISTPWRKIYTLHSAEANVDHFPGKEDESELIAEVDEEASADNLAMFQKDPVAANQSELESTTDDVGRGMLEIQRYFLEHNQSVIFKGGFADAMHSKDILAEMGTRFAAVNRKNKIDQLVCMTKDCFNEEDLGYPVANGTKSDLCWKRRFKEERTKVYKEPMEYKAKLNVDKLHKNLRLLEENVEKASKQLEKMGFSKESAKEVVMEDLLDFEWDDDAVGKAVFAWSHLLRAWGVHPSNNDIQGYLNRNTGTRDPPMKQHDTILNFEEVKTLLKDQGRFSWMIQE